MSKKELVIILIITFIVIIIWVVSDIFHSKPSVPLDPKLETILEPVDPNFDQETLAKLKNISLKSPPPISTKPNPTPTPLPRPSSSPIESSSSATTSGDLTNF
jgi:hypothetical protein